VLAVESGEHDQIGAVHSWHEAWLHRHAVRVLDAGGEAEHVNVIAANLPREVGQIRERGDDADLCRVKRLRRKRDCANRGEGQKMNQFQFHKISPFKV
jgi:hypothetical protein